MIDRQPSFRSGGQPIGYALPELYKFCEEHALKFIIGYATNAVLKGHTQVLMNYVQARAELHGEPDQRFQDIRDFQAGSWDRRRRVIAKCEVTAQGAPTADSW